MVTPVCVIDLGKSYTVTRRVHNVKEKCNVVKQINDLIFGLSCCQVYQNAQILALYCDYWKKLIKAVDVVNSTEKFVSCNMSGSADKIHLDCKSILSDIESEL